MRQIFIAFVLGCFPALSSAMDPIDFYPVPRSRESSGQPTPFFERKQFYLDAAPRGVGAHTVWSLEGGTGDRVKVIDIETGFQTEHEDFGKPFYVGENAIPGRDHGTAVWGVLAAKHDEKGVTGIAYGTQFGVYGFPLGAADDISPEYISQINHAIRTAVDQLGAGDVLLIEQQMTGPDHYAPVEYWPEIFAELKAATDRGILCIEAAGNGNSNLDGAVYEGAFDLKLKDSGCILVGSGDPDLNHHATSNYGSRIDAFGYGFAVMTTGFGDFFNGGPTRTYTDFFNGTSSASPIVAGAVAIVSSIAKTKGRTLTPLEIRTALRATGTPQNPRTIAKRIGNLPDIAAMLSFLGI